jgi:spore coat-associated protein N
MRSAATLLVSLATALGAIGLAVAAPGGLMADPELARVEVRAASGAVSISNSRAGQAVFNAAGMRPGDGVSGTVTIGNDGDRPGRFAFRAADVADSGPPHAGKLSERVELAVFDVTHAPVEVHAGPPAGFGQVDLGVIAPGGRRDYLVVATLPSGGDDNRFQGTALSLGLEWQATPVSGGSATPTPAPETPSPSTPSTPGTPSTPATPPVALADALGLPAATSCIKRGRLKLRLKAPAGAKLLSATVKVNGRVKARLKGKKAAKPVNLRGLKKKTKLAVSVKASNRRTYSASRTYKACKR